MKIFNTKYALTKGIMEQDASDRGNGVVMVSPYLYLCGEGKEWHRTRQEAIARAEAMRQSKIASLKKKLAKLENMKIE